MKKTVIFDFDGTLANSFDVVVRIFRSWSTKRYNVTDAQIERLRNMPAGQVMRELHIPFWRAPWLLAKGRREMTRRLGEVELFSGLGKVLEELKNHDVRMMVVSSNSERNIRLFLKTHRIEHYFDGVYGGSGLFGKHRRLERIVRANGFDKSQVFYVGDETRDVEAAKLAGLHSVAVGWGYNAPAVLETREPEYLVHTTDELLKVLTASPRPPKNVA